MLGEHQEEDLCKALEGEKMFASDCGDSLLSEARERVDEIDGA